MKNAKFGTNLYLKNSSPDSKADLGKKLILRVWKLILSRYDIVLHIYHTISIFSICIYNIIHICTKCMFL